MSKSNLTDKKDDPSSQAPSFDEGFAGLQAVDAVSLLGKHDGIMDDEMFEILLNESSE